MSDSSLGPLADQVAPSLDISSTMGSVPLSARQTWIDIPISCDEPVKVALFSQFLAGQDIPFEQSRRFISVPTDELKLLIDALTTWAFPPISDDDHRHVDSLNTTLREIGATVMGCIFSDAGEKMYGDQPAAIAGIDLRA